MSSNPVHWSQRDVRAELLAEALRPGAAPPVAIHVRPELLDLISRQAASPESADATGTAADRLAGIPLVVDDGIPAAPGYEIRRCVRPDHTGCPGLPPQDGRHPVAADDAAADLVPWPHGHAA